MRFADCGSWRDNLASDGGWGSWRALPPQAPVCVCAANADAALLALPPAQRIHQPHPRPEPVACSEPRLLAGGISGVAWRPQLNVPYVLTGVYVRECVCMCATAADQISSCGAEVRMYVCQMTPVEHRSFHVERRGARPLSLSLSLSLSTSSGCSGTRR